MKSFYRSALFVCVLSLFFIFQKSPAPKDTKVTFLYLCSIDGKFDFDREGREGLATVTELKRQEEERIHPDGGNVFLLTQGSFFENDKDARSFTLMKKAGFDAVVLSEEELVYLEKNPALKKLGLPVIAPRDNLFSAATEKIFSLDGVNMKLTSFLLNKLPYEKRKNVHLNLVFPDPGTEISLEDIDENIPAVFFVPSVKGLSVPAKADSNEKKAETPKKEETIQTSVMTMSGETLKTGTNVSANSADSKDSALKKEISLEKDAPKRNAFYSTALSFKSNVYTAECPEKKGVLGKYSLVYRNGKLIRQTQEFIPLNTKDHNRKWIHPDKEMQSELKKK